MELRYLRYFVAVAEELHFRRAADRLNLSQPSLSQQIRDLKEEIGLKLFERTKRRVELTEAGKVFLAETRKTLAQSEQAVRAAVRASRGEIGRLVIGFVQSATCSLLPETLRVFRERFPDVELVLEEVTTGQGITALLEDRLHLCFLRVPVDDQGKLLKIEPVVREKIVLALPAGHRLAAKAGVPLRLLAGEPFIIFPRAQGVGFYDQLVSLCRQAGFSPRVAQEAGQMQTILSLVAAELGVALIPATVRSLRGEGVVYRPLRERLPETGIAVAWRREDSALIPENFLIVVREESRRFSKVSQRVAGASLTRGDS